ncbi:MAG: DJ-1/PfpI family protein [Ferruginibacter sp.]
MKKNVGIFIFDDAEVLDIAGPFEVFSVTSQLNDYEIFDVFTVSKTADIVSAVNGLLIKPQYAFHNHPHIDILIISGGQGTRALLYDDEVLNWIKATHQKDELTLSICSGSRLLGQLGLLDGKPFCTHNAVYEHMLELAPLAIPKENNRYVQSGNKIYTSGGISAGIDLSFHIIESLLGKEKAVQTANYMEYTLANLN